MSSRASSSRPIWARSLVNGARPQISLRPALPGGGEARAAWVAKAREAEALGYATLLAPDHFDDQFAPIPALMAAADATTRLRLGSLVLANDFRHPVLLAKEAATLDKGLLADGACCGPARRDLARRSRAVDAGRADLYIGMTIALSWPLRYGRYPWLILLPRFSATSPMVSPRSP